MWFSMYWVQVISSPQSPGMQESYLQSHDAKSNNTQDPYNVLEHRLFFNQ